MTRRFFYKATITRVVDGDTMDVMFDLGLEVYHSHSTRLNGIDTPEIYRPQTELEREAGKLVTEYIKSQLLGKTIFIKTTKDSKYGDYLGDVYLNEFDVNPFNDFLINEGLARPYFGEKKEPWTVEQLNHIIQKLS
jgi:micrococcal nuclease